MKEGRTLTRMVITANVIITAASIVTASGILLGVVYSVFKWYQKQNKQDEDIKKIKDEQCMLCYAMLACLDGLKQLGANGNVTEAHEKLSKHINKSAHNCT